MVHNAYILNISNEMAFDTMHTALILRIYSSKFKISIKMLWMQFLLISRFDSTPSSARNRFGLCRTKCVWSMKCAVCTVLVLSPLSKIYLNCYLLLSYTIYTYTTNWYDWHLDIFIAEARISNTKIRNLHSSIHWIPNSSNDWNICSSWIWNSEIFHSFSL